jgi:hypothetical protein
VRFKKHSGLEGTHARYSASKPHWLNWSDDKLELSFDVHDAAAKGTRLHELARRAINDGIKMSEDPEHMVMPYQATVARYANECIDFGMRAEVIVRYNDEFFGTADALVYEPGLLQISDLKTGVNKVSPTQLYVYAAYFFLDYEIPPLSCRVILRIYQNGEVITIEADMEFVLHIMERVKYIDRKIQARLDAF